MRWLCLIFVMLAASVNGQFADDFSDGDFANNPTWSGDNAKFDIVIDTLHLNAPAVSDVAYLSTPSQSINNAVWEFFVRLDFNPSGANYARVYLVSDQPNLCGSLNGYFVKVGNSSDEISLYRQDGLGETEIIDGVDGRIGMSIVNVRIRATRDSIGNWELFSDSTGAANFVSEGAVTDTTYVQTTHFGVQCVYTSTRSDKFYYDDFNVTGQAFVDSIDPVIDQVIVLSNTQIDVDFSEVVDQTTAEILANYPANNGLGNPSSAVRDGTDSSMVHLTFGTAFTVGVFNTLTVNNVEDLNGNTISTAQEDFIWFIAVPAGYRDIIMNEIFADPSPQIGLPNAEFIELYNRSNDIFDLNGWQFTDGSTIGTLGKHILVAGERVILCANTNVPNYTSYGEVIGLSSWPALNNAGDSLTLLDSSGFVVDIVKYTDEWYNDANKDDGGWTLELINPNNPCSESDNWHASVDPIGGTPSKQNSVFAMNQDNTAPQLVRADAADSVQVILAFDESILQSDALAATYTIDKSYVVIDVNYIEPKKVMIELDAPIQLQVIYTATVTGLKDCEGNLIGSDNTARFGLPENAVQGDLVINEVLFNPRGSGSDFVELYNNSNKFINLESWQLANYDTDDDTIANFQTMSPVPHVIFPQEYVLLSNDGDNIKLEYPLAKEETFVEMSSMPSYNNEEGNVIVIDNNGLVHDRFDYYEDMHYPLLNNVDGVSLERLDFNRPADDETNWHSAAQNIGFATPGFENSQYNPTTVTGDNITISPEVFSPDNDGIDDVLNISYKFDSPGYVANVTIYDARGRLIKYLLKNELLSNEGTFSWDGTNEGEEKARMGIHIIYFEAFNLQGEVLKFKKTCVVASRL